MSLQNIGLAMRSCVPSGILLAVVCSLLGRETIGPATTAEDSPPAKKPLPADLALVPEDATVFLSLQIGLHWNGPEHEALKTITQAHPMVLTWETKDIEKETGLSMDEIERFVLIIPEFKVRGNIAAWVFTSRKPYDRKKVVATVVPEPKEETLAGKKVYFSEKKSNGLHLVNDRTILASTARGLREFLGRTAIEKEGALHESVVSAIERHLAVAGMVPTVFLPAIENAGERAKAFVPLLEAKSWRVTVDADKELRINFRLDFATEEKAKEAQMAVKAIVPPVVGYFKELEKELPRLAEREKEKYPKLPAATSRLMDLCPKLRAALGAMRSERQGSTVQTTLRIKTDEPATAFLLLVSMMPRSGKEEGPGDK